MVSSISPIHNNLPSLTVVQIDPSTAAVVDYRVFNSPDLTGDSKVKWKEEYDFQTNYTEPDYSSSSLANLISAFAADPGAKTPDSTHYIGHFSAGNSSSILQMFWPQYVCSLSNYTKKTFVACACANTR
jgi:hypothetical protein